MTSARHDVFGKYLAEKYPESYDAAVPEELVYSGKLKLTDSVEDSPIDAGKLVLSPTRTYAPVVKKLLDALRPEIHGMVHLSLIHISMCIRDRSIPATFIRSSARYDTCCQVKGIHGIEHYSDCSVSIYAWTYTCLLYTSSLKKRFLIIKI